MMVGRFGGEADPYDEADRLREVTEGGLRWISLSPSVHLGSAPAASGLV